MYEPDQILAANELLIDLRDRISKAIRRDPKGILTQGSWFPNAIMDDDIRIDTVTEDGRIYFGGMAFTSQTQSSEDFYGSVLLSELED